VRHALLILVRAFVVGKVNYCISVLAGFRKSAKSSTVDTECCCLTCGFNQESEHITPLLLELHWLRVPERIQFRLCVLANHCVHGTAPAYPAADSLQLTAYIQACHCRHLCSTETMTMKVPLMRCSTPATEHFQWQQLQPGMSCSLQQVLPTCYCSFGRKQKRISSGHHIC